MKSVVLVLHAALVLQSAGDRTQQHDDHATRAPLATVTPAPRTPLGDRIAEAAAGDTIRLAAGVHSGPIVVDRRVVLIGATGAIIDGRGTGSVVTMAADSAELRTLTIRNGGRSVTTDDAGVKFVRCNHCRIVGVRVEGGMHGIYVQSSDDVVIHGNEVAGDGALEEARRGNGIHLYSSARADVRGNTVRDTRDGIYVSFTSESAIERNDIERVRYGLHYMYSDDNRFTGNRFTRSAAGAAIMFSKRIVLHDNVFSDNIGYRAYGVLLQTSEQIEATRNRIEGNLVGVFLENATRNEFRGNLIVGNGVGIDLVPSAEANTFTENVIVDNRTSVRVSAGGGANAFAADGRGNYWGVRAAFDLDGDGLGDRPHRAVDAFGSLASARPVLEIFATTPAARVLSWVERTFPVFDVPHVEDPYPLATPPALIDGPARTSRGRAVGALMAAMVPVLLSALVLREGMTGRVAQ